MSVCVYICLYVCMYVSMYLFMYVYINVCMYVKFVLTFERPSCPQEEEILLKTNSIKT